MEGTWYVGTGESFDAAKLKGYPAGSFIVIPAGLPHFVAAKDGTSLFRSAEPVNSKLIILKNRTVKLIATQLLLTGNSVAITIHLRAGAVPEEELRFIAGCHL